MCNRLGKIPAKNLRRGRIQPFPLPPSLVRMKANVKKVRFKLGPKLIVIKLQTSHSQVAPDIKFTLMI